ncbi:MAG: glycosyltransferase family 39 protein [Candidatus Hydrogenedentes bacterium]|nr:glycosyltransferase family 39 protein [Candidatus Hydrogenedentota bacterium]
MIAALFLLGAALRLYDLGGDSLWYDEAASLYQARHSVAPATLLDPDVAAEPPVHPLLVRAWMEAVALAGFPATSPWNDFLLRLLPCLIGMAAMPAFYLLARRLLRDETAALFALALFAISPLPIYYARELRVYSLYVLLAIFATGFMIRALEENRPWQWAGMIGALALLMYSHFFAMWLIFTLNLVFVAVIWRYPHHFWRWTGWNALLMVLIAPAIHRAFVMHAETQLIEIPWYPSPDWKTPFITFKTFFAGFSPAVWAYWPLFLIALGLWAAGFRRARESPIAAAFVALMTWVPPLGCALIWGQASFSFYEHRLFLFSAAAAILGVAWGAATLGRAGLVAIAVLAGLTVPVLADLYAGRLHPIPMHRLAMWDKVDFRAAARHLEDAWRPGDRLLYASHFPAYSMQHYLPRDQVRIGWSLDDQDLFIRTMGHEPILRAHGLMPQPKEAAVAGASRIWFLVTEGTTFAWRPDTERIAAWLDAHYTREAEVAFDGVRLSCYAVR